MRHRFMMTLVAFALFGAACSGAPTANTTQPPVLTEAAAAVTEVQPSPTSVPIEPTLTETLPVETAASEPAATNAAPATPAASGLSSTVVYRLVPGETRVSYEVGETFLDQNRFATAIGVTTAVNGDISLDLANPQAAQIGEITVDISQLTSDSPRRDTAIRERFLASSQYPIATFVTTSITGLPATYTEGQEVTFQVTGDLMVATTTRPVTFDVSARIQGGELTGTATSMIKMSDFGVGPISMAVLRTEDDVKLTMTFIARPQ